MLAGLDPQLFDQRPARVLVSLQRIRLALAPVQGQHQLRAEALAVGVHADQRLEPTDQLAMAAKRQLGLVQVLDRGQPLIVQAAGLAPDERLMREVGKWCAAPQRERLLQRRGGALRVASSELAPALGEKPLEPVRVEPVGIEPQLVAVLAGNDHRVRAVAAARPERLSQARDVDLHGLRRGCRRIVSPQLIDEPLDRKRLVGVQQQ